MEVLKKKKVRMWCPGGGRDLGFQYDDESRKLAKTPEKRKVRHVRCLESGQRLEVYNWECHDSGCVHQQVPRNKAY